MYLHFVDVPKLRQTDINFALTAVLNVLWPSGARTMQVTAQNMKAATDMRAGSLTFTARDAKSLTKISITLYQVAFLGKQSFIHFAYFCKSIQLLTKPFFFHCQL